MDSELIRVLIVDADPGGGSALQNALAEMDDVDIVGVAHNKKTALEQAETTTADVLLVDVMLTGYRSMDVISHVAATRPDIRILAVTPGDPSYDRVILALQAGALGYVTKTDSAAEGLAAIKAVYKGLPWLPVDETYEVLREAAPDLNVTGEERRQRLLNVILGILPLSGMLAAFTALLWRSYWGRVGVRVADLGVDASTRMIDVLIFMITIIGIFGPLFFVETWVNAASSWVNERPGRRAAMQKGRGFRLFGLPVGRVFLSRTAAWIILAWMVVFVAALIGWIAHLVLILVIGSGAAILLIANFLGLGDDLPELLRISNVGMKRNITILTTLVILFLALLSAEVVVLKPDLRTDGVHGILAPTVLGLVARPARVHDLDGNLDPLEVLYIGGNADLYVLFDPCTDDVRLVPVGSSRVVMIDEVICGPP